MENEPASSKRGRLMGKLFGKPERKASNPEQPADLSNDLNDFFRRPNDPPASPGYQSQSPPGSALPILTKLDTSSASRYPNALSVTPSQQSLLPRVPSSRGRSRKGLVVRFVDSFPTVIGEGGDECELPTAEISRRKLRSTPSPVPPPRSPLRTPENHGQYRPPNDAPRQSTNDDFRPGPLRRVQTGHTSLLEPSTDTPRSLPAGTEALSRYLESPVVNKDENRRSFIEVQQAQMRQAEGRALAQAYRSASAGMQPEVEDNGNWRPPQPNTSPPRSRMQTTSPDPPQPPAPPPHTSPLPPHASPMPHASPLAQPPDPFAGESPDLRLRSFNNSPEQTERRHVRQPGIEQSPVSAYSAGSSYIQSAASARQWNRPPEYRTDSPPSPTKPVAIAQPYEDDALQEFAARSRHLFALFRLHSDAARPLMSSSSDSLVRAATWWFLKGRMALETAVRGDSPKLPTPSQTQEIMKQQAYADLAKAYWMTEEIPPDIMAGNPGPYDGEVDEVRKALSQNLRKLSMSMKRNGFLPPEDAVLPQTLKLSVWVDYPQVSQDIIALLHGSSGSSLAAPQLQTSPREILEALPLGDTTEHFTYGRIAADVFLMEQGLENQQFAFPCFLSMVRHQKSPSLMLVVASQNGAIQLKIQNSRDVGPTWEDVRWRNDACALELKLPRGFILAIRMSAADYRMLWSMYDFGEKVQSTLYPRKDEMAVFHTTLKSFQYFDSDPGSRQFPKEAVPSCQICLFERIVREGAATGPRSYHRGFRIAVVTGTRTRTMSGVNHAYLPATPIQFAFLKDDKGTPALLLKFENGQSKGRMVMSFNDERDRTKLHSILLGTRVGNDEMICADVPLMAYTVSQRLADEEGMKCIGQLPWKGAKVINVGDDSEPPTTVLAERLRVIVDFNHGVLNDRMNFAPGEFKIRLDIRDELRLRVLRPPQQDLTVAISEGDVSRELPRELSEAMQVIQASQTIRTFHFGDKKDLHAFQEAITGFKVLFDGTAVSFGISRRRMVVPIHKKWEAGATRIQVVQQEKVTQLLAFFEDWHHGHSMGFVLKGTDVFEAVGRGSKSGIKIDDAKFPLPRVPDEGASAGDDASFVCLDLPDLPGEHDDITIYFASEADRDNLSACLPAPVKNSKLSSLRMK
ncbi:hypothetical protein MGG_11715 [Pyricularia oryzae 70-15]|uniref:Uncharacterized protein n=3 Tax=Pyricularia oryzae TaxID=318829 RepID=G4MRM0_PYRO7|nr:uncharacterized protein MGG_11715 [Pyricularia oryzae 70-15]EHA57443.1 hypothetical protein MGG_11715 [Pyricularia oryzae 70-15]ELQ42329.1 hypothetical protein OOU_Y34scaffold00215g13 [Pyricularia oryzae Y34]KAI7928661.1 hypothetical protein M9X92_001749 [Pyricularia oryzae]KAI7928751.1 hypothetical protein M0657_002575 [Pyricularia oryzae]